MIITPEQFCMDFFKDLQKAEPLDRKPIVVGYAKTLEAMLEAARKEGKEEQ